MANRYWVGDGSVQWVTVDNESARSCWASSSGGASGVTVPSETDDVIFDSNSVAALDGNEVTVGNGTCRNLTITGNGLKFRGVTGLGITVHGNVAIASTTDWGAGQSISQRGPDIIFRGSACELTTNGVTLYTGTGTGNGIGTSSSGSLTLQDDLTVVGPVFCTGGTFNANNNNVTAQTARLNGSTSRTLNMGTGTWTLTGSGSGVWDASGSNLTLNASTSTIKLTDASSSSKTFNGGGKTYNLVWFSGNGSGSYVIAGSNTFSELQIDPRTSGGRTVQFTAGTTQTVTTFDVVGTSGNLIAMQSSSEGNQWDLSKASGTVECDFISLKDSVATGGATWIPGENSVDAGNNAGWIFPLTGGSHRMFAVF